jgi:site-specific recombinase XerD
MDTINGIALYDPALHNPVHLAVAGFLARYGEPTRSGYACDLRAWFAWCEQAGLPVLEAQRPHIELFARQLEEEAGLARSTVKKRLSTMAGFYKFAAIDGHILRSPAEHVRRPVVDNNESTTLGLDRMELGGFLAQAAATGNVMDHALACLLGLLGMRVSEACSINIEDLGVDRGHRTVRIIGKGHKFAVMPLPPRVARAVDAAKGERTGGPLLLCRSGARMDRFAATRIVKRLCRRAGIDKRISPHSLRHSFITAALDAGVPLRDVQIAARHADPRTTTRYDRARHNLDRHASYIVTAFVAGGA